MPAAFATILIDVADFFFRQRHAAAMLRFI